ncbi:T9SS type A sorting domain-containing protein [Oceanihabitans sp. 2_MG-2023]|uniref:T9SS type A sorting domain-containing protein n=1 Tax=Oceanihabitans sp. 2_MG-2023 TaxID=3062661 RepID=UPI0026E48B25|nr:T9SS type A sorting domain-containing protein [Oceanihabitans sp. 2_MG-2023]MDO6595504.1 T9SS type A sorting domain-containing protein [Oceanihabitans sp. 2_MG-2023]
MTKNYILKKRRLLNMLFVCLAILMSYTSIAQNLNFTIDTATDNEVTITETIVNGGDTYVLTIAHSGNEELDDLGGGDLIFYLSAIDPLTPHVLSITRNGIPTNFTLNGLDYDTLEAGTISVTNQDNAEISSPTNYPFGGGAITITNASNAVNISSFNIIPTDIDDLNDIGFHNIDVTMTTPCVAPAGTASFVSQDCGAGTFMAEVNVTDLGGGTPSIFDGTTTTAVTATGVMSFGPYPAGTPINFTLQHGSDTGCDVDLGSISDTCPPPCMGPAAEISLLSQDCTLEDFTVSLVVTDLGSGTPMLFDGTTTYPITETGASSYGPYPAGTPVAFTLQHGSDSSCDLDLGEIVDTCDEIIFTIDDAVDNGTSITETIVKDGDTYVLTVAHSGNEELDDLGGGDLVFYHSATNPLDPYILSITRNGFDTNFTFKGMDYDTFEAGTIAITNQDDAEISSPTSYALGTGAIVITNTVNATDISSFNILPTDSDDLHDFGFHNIKVDIIDTCAAGEATAVFLSEDCVTNEFFVEVNVTALGNGSTAVFDGTTSTAITATGAMSFGPYPTGIPVSFTLQHGSDAACDVDLGTISDTCPLLPSNDECTGAIDVTCGETVTGSTSNATDTAGNASTDVWYAFTAGIVDQDVTVSLCGSLYDTALRVYSDCSASTQVMFVDDFCGVQSEGVFTATANTTYYILVEGYATSDGTYTENGDFTMTITCIDNTISIPANDDCSNPETLVINAAAITGTTAGASDQTTGEDDDTVCNSYEFHADVWYAFTLDGTYNGLTVLTSVLGNSTEASVAVYPAPICDFLDVNSIACSSGNASGESLALGTLAAGTYYVRVWSDGVASGTSRRVEGEFEISVNGTLSISDVDTKNLFTYYPNPVTSSLTIKAQNSINGLSVYNMLGQEVILEKPNTMNSVLDMSSLQSGAYFVKVTVDNVTKTIRIIKE